MLPDSHVLVCWSVSGATFVFGFYFLGTLAGLGIACLESLSNVLDSTCISMSSLSALLRLQE